MRIRVLLAVTVVLAVGGCTGSDPSPGVPSIAGSGQAGRDAGKNGNNRDDDKSTLNDATGDGSAARRARLHEAAECIRRNGAPNYPDPVLTADGRVYTDSRLLHDAVDEDELAAIEDRCGEQIRAARFDVDDQAPPPPKLVQAGVRSAACLRENGFPDYPDPTAESRFTPGKGFGLNGSALPSAGKADPTVLRALRACRGILDEEARLSSLGSLADA